jgi:hypothetical protein
MKYLPSAISRNTLLSTDTRPTNIRRKDYVGSINKYYKPCKDGDYFTLYTGDIELVVYTSRAMTLLKDVCKAKTFTKVKVGDVLAFIENGSLVVLEVEAFSTKERKLIYQVIKLSGKERNNVMQECSDKLAA